MTENQIVGELTKGFIYEIRCNITNKCYYGSSKEVEKRLYRHKRELKSKRKYLSTLITKIVSCLITESISGAVTKICAKSYHFCST